MSPQPRAVNVKEGQCIVCLDDEPTGGRVRASVVGERGAKLYLHHAGNDAKGHAVLVLKAVKVRTFKDNTTARTATFRVYVIARQLSEHRYVCDLVTEFPLTPPRA